MRVVVERVVAIGEIGDPGVVEQLETSCRNADVDHDQPRFDLELRCSKESDVKPGRREQFLVDRRRSFPNPGRRCLLEPADHVHRDASELLDSGSWVFASPDDADDYLTNPYERPRDIRRSTRSRKTVIKDLVTYFRGRW